MIHSSHQDINSFCELIKSRHRDVNYDHVIGITRGGLVPAVYLSHSLDLPLSIVSYSSPTGNGEGCNTIEFLNDKLIPITVAKKVILVDDICDTGETIKYVHQYLTDMGVEVHTASIFYREGSCFKPNMHLHVLSENDPWVKFDWE